ncbi:hypothetical protein E8P77_07595 [Soehngenia saccharolytica]|nr:hypothetical protein E8P77_07595 [Soehngenia saccharolytica]
MIRRYILTIFCLILLFTGPVYGDKVEIILSTVKDDYDIPEISGPIDKMPWKNQEDFIKAKEKYHTPILMAGFCAVLKNPLPGEEHNVAMAAQSIKGQVIKPEKIFSQNQAIGPYTEYRGYKTGSSYTGNNIVMTEGGGVCKIATSLYNLAVLSDLEIIERHYHSMPINYVPYGQDATVAYGIKDFRFKNTSDGNILIWSKLIGNKLYMGFYGNQYSPIITWDHNITDVVKPSIKYVKNEDLSPGDMNTKIKGLEGANIESSITILYRDGTKKIKKMSPSRYLPLPELIEMN